MGKEFTMEILVFVIALLLIALVALATWRWLDLRAEARLKRQLLATQPVSPKKFSPEMVADLPDPARRFFEFAIRPGTLLTNVAEIDMSGEFSLGTKETPNYMAMQARQLLAGLEGFLWRVRVGSGLMRFAGSDAAGPERSWSRFWLLGLVPVARAGGNDDHARSAFGRYVAEAVFWTPAALLPRDGIRWEAVDESMARVRVVHGGRSQSVDVTIGDEGQPTKIVFPRWSDANADKVFRFQPFGGYMSEFRDFEGFRLPTRIEAGNLFGTPDYFPFFLATVQSIRFPARG